MPAAERRSLAATLRGALTADLLGGARRLRLPEPLVPVRASLQLLMSRRPGVFVVLDALLLLVALLTALEGNGEAREAWLPIVFVPLVLLGSILLSDVVAVDRRSGSLDLALSSPGARNVFERRLLAGLSLLLAQAWLVILVMWLGWLRTFALVPVLVHATLLCAVLGAAALFWAVRLATAGAVMLAVVATVLGLGKWTLSIPIAAEPLPGMLLPPLDESGDWLAAAAVLATAAVLLYLHARRRLDRPELLLR